MTTRLEKINLTLTTYLKAYQFIKRQDQPDRIKAVQNQKLRRLVTHCYKNIKYYRELFNSNRIKPDDIQSTADLIKIPILTKDELRRRFWDFLPSQLPSCRVSRTSGSTGIPVCILSDANSRINNSAAVIRYRRQLGIPIFGRSILTLLKSECELPKPSHWTILQGIHKTFYINPYSTQEQDLRYAEKVMKQLNKPALIGITPAVRALACRIRDGHLPGLLPSAVLTTGEYLDFQARSLLEETFMIGVTDIYGCNEAGDIAWQCRKEKSYHINADNCIIEILKDGKPAQEGQTGEVVITNLNRYSMPFVRYKNGDLASFETKECSCGCRLPVLQEIIGRSGEDFCLPDGRKLQWNVLKGAMNHNQIRQFQLIQNPDASVTVKYIPEESSNASEIENLLKERFKNLLPCSLSMSFKVVRRIPPAPSGKTKLVVCNYRP